jgi:hypothetical protein
VLLSVDPHRAAAFGDDEQDVTFRVRALLELVAGGPGQQRCVKSLLAMPQSGPVPCGRRRSAASVSPVNGSRNGWAGRRRKRAAPA